MSSCVSPVIARICAADSWQSISLSLCSNLFYPVIASVATPRVAILKPTPLRSCFFLKPPPLRRGFGGGCFFQQILRFYTLPLAPSAREGGLNPSLRAWLRHAWQSTYSVIAWQSIASVLLCGLPLLTSIRA
ncbi:hypothetical protein [Helicobacter sp. T3_23-1056]